ncbi:MAG: hypothetical protein JO006_01360 [Paucibacter sp.]|nr:hypothetical protein [Roseateles sp.]
MLSENLSRNDLSPLERGKQYKAAREMPRFRSTSLRKLADALGVKDFSGMAKALRLAELPECVLKAFASPKDIQVNWGAALHEAIAADEEGVYARAAELASASKAIDPEFIFQRLCNVTQTTASRAGRTEVVNDHQGNKIATLELPKARSRKGIVIRLEPAFGDVDGLKATLRAYCSLDRSPQNDGPLQASRRQP